MWKMAHFGKGKHKCHIRKKSLHVKHFNQHLRIHTQEKSHKCKTCGKCFGSKANLNQHEITHSAMKPYKCSICCAAFGRKGHLKRHEQTHSNPLFHSCPHCTRKYTQKDSQRGHVKAHKSSFSKPNFNCIFCEKTLHSRVGYSLHLKAHVAEARVFCELCDRGFANIWLKNEHIRRSHTLERPFGCEVCGKRFFSKGEAKGHSFIHLQSDELRPYSCIFCEKGFYRKAWLFQHIWAHVKEKWFSCSGCGKAFLHYKSLNYHNKHTCKQ